MNVQTPFQYAILRYIHDQGTEEFLNIGLAMYSQPENYFRAQVLTRYRRVTQTFPGASGKLYKGFVDRLQR